MIQLARRSSVQPAMSLMIAGSATAVIISSAPTSMAAIEKAASSTAREAAVIAGSVSAGLGVISRSEPITA